MICDNINDCHDNIVINETEDGIRTRCRKCGQINVLRCEKNGRFNNKEYSKVFYSDIVQPGSNLYYKLHPELMLIV